MYRTVFQSDIQGLHPIDLPCKASADEFFNDQNDFSPTRSSHTRHVIDQFGAGLVTIEIHGSMKRDPVELSFEISIDFNGVFGGH